MINGLFEYGAMPTLERVVQFTQQRHKVLSDNIANLSTPFFQPRDVAPVSFQTTLREAIDQRRHSANPASGPLELRDSRDITFHEAGMTVHGRPVHQGIFFHDQNNRDLERTMQSLAENTMTHNSAIELLRNEFSIMLTAIRERV